MARRPVQILVADDHPMVAQGLADLLAETPGFAIAGCATDPAEALRVVARRAPRLAVVGLNHSAGFEPGIIAELRRRRPVWGSSRSWRIPRPASSRPPFAPAPAVS